MFITKRRYDPPVWIDLIPCVVVSGDGEFDVCVACRRDRSLGGLLRRFNIRRPVCADNRNGTDYRCPVNNAACTNSGAIIIACSEHNMAGNASISHAHKVAACTDGPTDNTRATETEQDEIGCDRN
jgi:hypothetical protein